MIMKNLGVLMISMMRKFAEELEEIANGCGNGKQPEERLAELLASIGLIKKTKEGYKLTEVGMKFLKITAET